MTPGNELREEDYVYDAEDDEPELCVECGELLPPWAQSSKCARCQYDEEI